MLPMRLSEVKRFLQHGAEMTREKPAFSSVISRLEEHIDLCRSQPRPLTRSFAFVYRIKRGIERTNSRKEE